MPTFGDFEDADSFDTADADPEAVARIMLKIRHDLAPDGHPPFDELHELERVLWIFTLAALLARLNREGI